MKMVGSSISADNRIAGRAESLKMKNVAPKARSLGNASPLTIHAMASSQIPQCKLQPPGVAGLKAAAAGEFGGGFVRRAEVRRTAEKPGNVLGEDIQDFT